MEASPKMQKVVEAIGQKFGVDFTQTAAQIRLDMPHYDRLCIENIGFKRISVAHYFESNGDLVAEPDIVFFMDDEQGWLPIEITQSMTGWASYVEMSDDGMTILQCVEYKQIDLARFAETWAQNIIDQKWLERATKHERAEEATENNAQSTKAGNQWPEPTTDEPDLEAIADWMVDSVCEATDGCIVEPDGICPHGHPSWLLRLGLM